MPGYAPMQFNTAICFALSGLQLVLLMLGRRQFVTILGAIVIAFGGLTWLQYLADIHLGMDEMFWQHQITTHTSHQGKPVGVGTGLGLSFCKGIIESHDGRILVDSEAGQGAVFHIELPIGSAPQPTAPPPIPPSQIAAQNKSILVIDDEDGIRRALSRLLSRDGYTVDTAANGRLDRIQAPRLHKPFNAADCRQTVRQVLQRFDDLPTQDVC